MPNSRLYRCKKCKVVLHDPDYHEECPVCGNNGVFDNWFAGLDVTDIGFDPDLFKEEMG